LLAPYHSMTGSFAAELTAFQSFRARFDRLNKLS
jgi:hypothetical protein